MQTTTRFRTLILNSQQLHSVHIVIAGGSGFLGSLLIKKLCSHGVEVTLLTRNPHRIDAQPRVKVVYWDGKSLQLPPSDKPIEAVINLCGLSIARWWTPSAKSKITQSRIEPSKALVEWCLSAAKPPKTFIQISGIDYYDLSGSACSETDNNGHTFLARLSKEWEETTRPLQQSATRLIIPRLAPVLAKNHPPLQPLLISTQCFLGSIAGPGTQYFSWIHNDDFTNTIYKMIQSTDMSGIYNLCAPNPVPYATFMRTIATIYHRPIWLSLPSWLMRSLLGEMASLILDNRKVFPTRLSQSGHQFKYPEIQQALTQIIQPACTKSSTNNHS